MEKSYFSDALIRAIKDKFSYVDTDPQGRRRLFFENSGGSLRLRAAVEAKAEYEKIPDCPERYHDISMQLRAVKEKGIRDIMQIIFGAAEGQGALVTELTSSQCMFRIVRTILENTGGTNVVVSSIEHPSAFDSVTVYAKRTGREVRVAKANPETGAVEVEEVLRHVDKDTALISVMSASNITGSIMDIRRLVKEARAISPDVYIVSDAVQHMPHAVLHVSEYGLDGMNFAPYKAFGIRGCGYGYVSDRVAGMPHDKLIAKPEKEWELGTFPHPNFAAMSAVVDYVAWLGSHFTGSDDRKTLYDAGMTAIHKQELTLLHHMLEGSDSVRGLRHIPGVEIYTDTPDTVDRDLIAAIGIKGWDYTALREEYYRRGVTVFERVNTSLYSKRIVESLGLTGCIRVSPLHCHSFADIDRFLEITAAIAAEKS